MAKASFIGLGVMGFPMTGHLQRSGHVVTVRNRTREKAERWREQHGGARFGKSSLILYLRPGAERPDHAS